MQCIIITNKYDDKSSYYKQDHNHRINLHCISDVSKKKISQYMWQVLNNNDKQLITKKRLESHVLQFFVRRILIFLLFGVSETLFQFFCVVMNRICYFFIDDHAFSNKKTSKISRNKYSQHNSNYNTTLTNHFSLINMTKYDQ